VHCVPVGPGPQAWLARIRPNPKHKVLRLLECALVSIGTVALRFTASHLAGSCVPQPAAWGVDNFGVGRTLQTTCLL